MAQQRSIKGKVLEYATQQPVIGATVMASGTRSGTTTDMQGAFSLVLPPGTASLQVSYVGYESQTVPIDTVSSYTILLRTSENSLKQLVVVGYGTQRKADLTGAVSTVDMKKTFDSKPLTDVTKALQGIVPGLAITYSNGALTAAPDIRLRGVGSVNGSSAPLILVDNVPTPDLSVIDANDIASISVLKDAASAAIYGARAAFGVVLIKTKYGHHNQPTRVTYSNNFSWNTPTVLPDFSDPVKELPGLISGAARAGNNSPELFGMQFSKELEGIKNWEQNYAHNRKGIDMVDGEDFDLPNGSDPSYFYRVWDIKGMMLKKYTPQQTQNLSVVGGTEKTSYYMSFNYNHQGGIMKPHPDDLKKYNVTAGVDVAPTDWLDLSAKILYRNFRYTQPYQYQQYFYYMWRWPAYFPYGTYQGSYFRGPIGYLNLAHDNTVTDNYSRVDLGAVLRPLPHLSIEAHYTINRDNVLSHIAGGPAVLWNFWSASMPLENVASASNDQAVYSSGRDIVNTFNGFVTYDNTFADVHHLTVMGGVNAEDDENISFSAEKRNLLDPNKPELSLATGDQLVNNSHVNAAYAGFFGRVNYAYKDKYLLELNGRYDGSSAYSPTDRWAFFSSGSLGYRISAEPFMDFIQPLFSDLKIRASLGAIGNLDVGGQYFIPGMSSYNANWIVDGVTVPTFNNPLAIANSLKWEKVRTLDFGLDFGILKNYISGSFDWYQRTTTGMISTNSVPATFGAAAPHTNQGNMRDRGFEVDINLNYPINDHFSLFARLSLANNKAVITKWNNPAKVINQNYDGAVYGDIWGFATDRYFTNDDFDKHADGSLTLKSGIPSQSGLENGDFTYGPGDIKFKDLNGDGKIDGGNSTAADHGDLTVIGNTQPQYLYGAQLGGQCKGFDLYLFLQGVGKRDMWGVGDMVIPMYSNSQILYKHQLDYWTPDNPNAKYPNPYAGNSGGTVGGLLAGGHDFYPQTKYLLNLAYCRLKNLTIGYSLPEALVHRIHLQKVRFYVSGENLAEISHVGVPLDPEITDGELGYTGRTFPFQRNYSFGLQLTF
ncbi:TonB-dependent receptor [Compostibacter hankyongensis]|uniref:TonB-dependent receptor n=1 Tax=Compostibacter hankyongensis TaxID=1007089 RepID=A0ABP8FQR1_9BACT